VTATVEHGGEANVAANEEDADALGGVDFVARDGKEVDVLERAFGAEVEREPAHDLDGVGVEESARGVGDSGQRGDGLDDAGLVVGEHDADEFCLGADGGEQGGGLNNALRGAGENGYFYLLFGEGRGGAEDGVVLDAGGNEVSGCGGVLECAEEGKVVALGAAGGEDDLGGTAVEETGDLVASVVDGGASELTLLMDGAGVAVVLQEEGTHGFKDFGQERCGRVRVHVDSAHVFYFTVWCSGSPFATDKSQIEQYDDPSAPFLATYRMLHSRRSGRRARSLCTDHNVPEEIS